MAQNINRLTTLVGNLKNSLDQLKNNPSDDGDGGGDGGGPRKRGRNNGANNGPNENHPKFGKYTAGMAVDPSWSRFKKQWWVKCAKTDPTNTEAWKAHEKARAAKIIANAE